MDASFAGRTSIVSGDAGGLGTLISGVDLARSFNGTSDFLQAPLSPLSGVSAMTASCWLWQNAFDSNDGLALEYSVNTNINNGSFFIDPNSGSFPGTVEISYVHIGGGGSGNDVSFPRPSAAAWHHWLVQINAALSSSQIVAAYIDGVSQTLTQNINTAPAGTFGNYNLYFMTRAGSSLFNAGRMADPAIWNTLLNGTQIANLAAGMRARNIGANANLIGYWPIQGLSPEPDVSGNGNNATVTGTTVVAGPPQLQRY